jgi:hypothetical protein
VWALSTLPVTLGVLHTVKPSVVARGSAGLYTILSVLQILITNEFFNIRDVLRENEMNQGKRYAEVTMAGFAILAIGALLTCIFESVMVRVSLVSRLGRVDRQSLVPRPATCVVTAGVTFKYACSTSCVVSS